MLIKKHKNQKLQSKKSKENKSLSLELALENACMNCGYGD